MKFSDEELMVLFSNGMNEAFDMLYERYRHRLYRFALSCLKNSADAEDVVQEVFTRVINSAARYRPMGRLQAWLFQITANRIRSYTTFQNYRQHKPDLVNGNNPQPQNPEKSAVAHDFMIKALAVLPENQRMALVLKEVEGMNCDTIARCLDLTSENVRVLIHRGRKNLLTFLQSNDHNQGE